MILVIKHTDPDFIIKEGDEFVNRAEIQVSRECPEEYRKVIFECYDRGWLSPVAYVLDRDLMWDKLHE